jgi:hypothetical protein
MVNMTHLVVRTCASIAGGGAKMSVGDWKNLEADVRKALKIGKQNRETVIEVVTRILWLERHKHKARIVALNETLRVANGEPKLQNRTLTAVVAETNKYKTLNGSARILAASGSNRTDPVPM